MKSLLFYICTFISFGTLNAQEFQMSDGSQTTCSGVFTDSQGIAGNYSAGETLTFTICPSVSTNFSQISFSQFNLAPGDILIAYDGDNTSAPFVGAFGSFLAPTIIEASTSNTSGCITFVFTSNPSSSGAAGWIADINCADAQTTIENVTSPSLNSSYGIGATIPIVIRFSEPVDVLGMPRLNLETGSIDRVVNYSSGSGTDLLTFNYTVQAGDISQDLNYQSSSSLILNGGSIKNSTGDDASILLPTRGSSNSLGGNKNIRIDGIAPQGYAIAFDLFGGSDINYNNATHIEFDITGAEIGTRLDFTFSSSGGTDVITGFVTITNTSQRVDNNGLGYNLSTLADGNITLTAVLTDNAGNSGVAATDTTTKAVNTNDNLANAQEIFYNQNDGTRPFNFLTSTVEAGETFNNYRGTPLPGAVTGSLWFKFVATRDDVFFRTSSDGVMDLSIQFYRNNGSQLTYSNLGTSSNGSYGNDLSGIPYEPWGNIHLLNIGETYYIQVHNNNEANVNFNVLIEPVREYRIINGAWNSPLGNPDGISDPYASVHIDDGNPVFNAPNTTIGNLHISVTGNLITEPNSNLTVNGILRNLTNQNGLIAGQNSTLNFIDHSNDFFFGSFDGLRPNLLHNVNVYNRLDEIIIAGDIDIKGRFRSTKNLDGSVVFVTFKHNADDLGVLTNDSQFPGVITGNVIVENYIPERLGTEKRAFRFLGSSVASSSNIFDQWQESGNSPSGFGTHITGSAGTAGTSDTATGLDQTSSGNNSMFRYNATATTWEAINSTNQAGDVLNSGEGYRLFVRGDRNVDLSSNASSSSTTLRSTGALSMADKSVSYDVDAGQFVLIANPYQNAMRIEDLIDDSMNIMDDVVYYWDPNMGGATGLGAYVTYTGFDNGGTGSGLPAASNNHGFIQPGQAVFLVANAGANGPTNDMIVNFSKSQLNESGVLRGAANRVNSISSGNGDRIIMNFYDTFSYENGYSVTDAISLKFSNQFSNMVGIGDFTKIHNAHESIAISQDNTDFAIASREIPLNNEIIPLKHYNYDDVDYTYVIDVDGLVGSNVFLFDNYTSTSTPLVSGTNVVAFSVDTAITDSIDADRFQLRFEDVTLGIGEEITEADFKMYPNPTESNETVFIQSSQFSNQEMSLTVTDLSGKLINSQNIVFSSLGKFELKTNSLKTGIYLIEITNNQNLKLTKKLVIK